jgi:hypothetical protein
MTMQKPAGTLLLLALLLGGSCAGLAGETAEVGRADKLKAGYLLNFAKFVEWPSSQAPEVLTICFLGGTGVHDALSTDLDRKRVGLRRLELRVLGADERPDGCAVLYMESTDAAELRRLIREARQAVLTVSDSEEFVHHGGMIEMFTESNRLRFSINVGNARRAGLRISSILLQLASTVEQGAAK